MAAERRETLPETAAGCLEFGHPGGLGGCDSEPGRLRLRSQSRSAGNRSSREGTACPRRTHSAA